MQTTLLGIALALIVAILAAFAAPFFIDWNEWRQQLEAQASALAGTRVTIAGNIDLTLLPTPAFVLRGVSLGDPVSGTGMRAAEMRGSLSLTSLASGKIEASEFVLSRPAVRLVIEPDGRLLLPAGGGTGHEISVSGFVLEAGSLTIEDRRAKQTFVAEDFSARGDLASREGPFRLDGGFRLHGERWIFRASAGRFAADQSGKARVSLERPSDATSFEAEGILSLAKAAPRFDGVVAASRASGELPWRLTSQVSGDVIGINIGAIDLALGRGELPITLNGSGKFTPYMNPALTISLESKRIDLDLGDPKAATAGAGHVLPIFGEIRKLVSSLALDTHLSVSADGVLAGGQLARDVRGQLRTSAGSILLEKLEAKLPGRASISLSGKNESEKFNGPFSFSAEEPQIFVRWLLGEEPAGKLQAPSSVGFKANIAYTREEIIFENVEAFVAEAKLTGRLLFQKWSDRKSHVLQADLRTQRANFDALVPFMKGEPDFLKEQNFTLDLYAEESILLGKPLRTMTLALTNLPDGLQIKNLTIDDLGGLSVTAKRATPDGKIEFSAEAVRPSGFSAALEHLSGSADFANIVSQYAESSYPIRFEGFVAPLKEGWQGEVKSADRRISFDLGALRDDRRSIAASLRLPETEIQATGELRFNQNGQFEPSLALNLKSKDLRQAFVIASRASSNAVPANAAAQLRRDANNLVFDQVSFELEGSRGSGRFVFPLGAVSPFSGMLSLDKAEAEDLFSLAVGRAHVSYVELGIPLLANYPGRMKVEIGTLAVSQRIALEKVSFDIRAGRVESVFENFQAQLAGGKINGSLRVADTYPRVLEIKLDADELPLVGVLATQSLRGSLRASLALSGNGNTQDELLASLAGQGTVTISKFELGNTDATAVASVFASLKESPDEYKIEQALLAALERGPLKVSRLEAPVVAANGIFRSGSAKAKAGNTEITLSGSLNLPKSTVDALLNIEVLGESSARPGAALRWQGPLDAPVRRVDAKALIAAITLRTIERGGQNTPNTKFPAEDRIPAVKKKTPSKSEIETAPLLPPPAHIPAAPQPRSQN